MRPSAHRAGPPASLVSISRFAIESFSRTLVRRRVRLRVAGLRHVPREGPALLAARHYHHLYDAAILMTVLPRPVHFLVALDWAHSRRERSWLELACRLARWPGLLRPERVARAVERGRAAYAPSEVGPYLRAALADSVELLGEGRALVVFPEAYPTVDPEGAAKSPDGFLPFRSGFVRLARIVERRHRRAIPIVPVGFRYERHGAGWRADVRFGPPIMVQPGADEETVARESEATVRALSGQHSGLPMDTHLADGTVEPG